MKKEIYQTPDFNVVELDAEDVITASSGVQQGGGWTDPDPDIPMGPPI